MLVFMGTMCCTAVGFTYLKVKMYMIHKPKTNQIIKNLINKKNCGPTVQCILTGCNCIN